MATDNNGPLVSILTPAYQAAKYLKETLDSVRAQKYPNIEHIVVDGGSTDGTVDILRRYPHLRWISEPDQGQSDALNKAFALSQGEIIGWLNADDLYEPGAVAPVAAYFAAHPAAMVVYGNCTVFDPDGSVAEYWRGPYDHTKLLEPWRGFHGAFQPAIFYRRELIERIGGWAIDLHYVMDYDILLRASETCDFDYLDVDVARFRRHPEQKGALAWHKFVREVPVSIGRFWSGKGIWRRFIYLLKARDFYALALLEQITKRLPGSHVDERTVLGQALRVSLLILRFPWVRHRYLASLLGSDLEAHFRRIRAASRGN